MPRRLLAFLISGMLLPVSASGAGEYVPTRYGLNANYGLVYDPGGIDFVQLGGFALFDYDAVWSHRAPESLRLKAEINLGATTAPGTQAIVSANMLALYFLDAIRGRRLRPYVEAGIGLIYTDFRVTGQGLRINFNPQAGIGVEIDSGNGFPWLAALRLHHVSNSELHKDNRGINSIVISFGRFFK